MCVAGIDESGKPHPTIAAPHPLMPLQPHALKREPTTQRNGNLVRARSIEEPNNPFALPKLADPIGRMPHKDLGGRGIKVIQLTPSPAQRVARLAVETPPPPIIMIRNRTPRPGTITQATCA